MKVQFQQLSYFVTVADLRNFTRAAAAVHVAQPSLSKQIQTLERELGAPLFNRARGNITLTAAGETLLPFARRVLADVEAARVQVRELVGLERGRLRLGATPSVSTVVMPSALRTYRDRYPGIDVAVEEGGSRDLVRLLADGQLDVALLIGPLKTRGPALETETLLDEPLVVAVATDYPLPSRSIRVRDLAEHPLVMFRAGYDLRDATLEACRAAGVVPTYAVEGGEMDAVLRFTEAGLGIAVLPSMVLDGRPGLRRIDFDPPTLSRTVVLAHRRDVALSAAARAFREVLLAEPALKARQR